jgi:photosystem II stability/assembly factor-like uncharacterized protein
MSNKIIEGDMSLKAVIFRKNSTFEKTALNKLSIMRRIITLGLALITALAMHGQEYKRLINEGTHTVDAINQSAENYFDSVGRGRGTGYKQYRRWLYFAERMMDETGKLKSQEFFYNELIEYNAQINQEGTFSRTTVGAWEDMGPTYWNATSGYNPGVGRITSLSVEEGNLNHIIAGSETGGVWKSTDGGVTWQVLTDNLANIDVYALAIDPLNSAHYYWGSTNGAIFKSTDGGATWSLHSSLPGGVVNKILIDPTNTSKIYASAQGGGLYKSTDGGVNWSIIANGATTGYDFEFKPGDPSVVYASGTTFYKSTDGGATFSSGGDITGWSQEFVSGNLSWTIAGGNQNASVTPRTGNGLGFFYINNFSAPSTRLISPQLNLSGATNPVLNFSHSQAEWFGDQDELKVFYKTSLTGTWVELAHYTTNVTSWSDITLSLPNPSGDYYIAFEGLANYGRGITLDDISVEADNLGVVFDEGFEGASNQFSSGVKMIGVSDDDPSVVYVLEADGNVFGGFHKSTDEGSSFVKLDHTGKNYFGYDTLGADNLGQAPRDMDVVVNPEDVNDVHIAGINSWRSTDGGTSFNITSQWVPSNAASLNIGYCHADVDIMLFAQEGDAANPTTKLFLGTDGGIFRTENPLAVNSDYYTDITTGMGIRQFYKIGISQTDPVIVTGGSQDNGSSVLGADGNWTDWWGADGMEGFVDKDNSQILYGTTQFGSFVKTLNGGLNVINVTQPDGKGGNFNWNWIVPYEQDPAVPNRIYAAFDEVYRSDNGGSTWTSISQNFGANIDHFKVAPSNNGIKYLAINGNFYFSLFDNTNWTQSTLNLNGGRINEIAVHPSNPNQVAIATTNSGKVYVSDDFGSNWTSIAWDLPNFVPLSLVWQGNEDDGLYVGMNYGVYYTDNELGNTWIPFNNGLPNVRVNELEINATDNKLYAGTYGRGLWRTDLYDSTLNVSDLSFEEFSLYPNPARDVINIRWNGNENPSVRIYNSLGKLVYYAKNVNLRNTFQVETSNFSEGLYFVKLSSSLGEITKKVVIE